MVIRKVSMVCCTNNNFAKRERNGCCMIFVVPRDHREAIHMRNDGGKSFCVCCARGYARRSRVGIQSEDCCLQRSLKRMVQYFDRWASRNGVQAQPDDDCDRKKRKGQAFLANNESSMMSEATTDKAGLALPIDEGRQACSG